MKDSLERNRKSAIRSLRGPVTLITVGVLFAFNNFTAYSFGQTWPVILIVFGLLSLLSRTMEPPPPPMPQQPPPPVYTAPPYTPPPAPPAQPYDPAVHGSYDPLTGAYIPPRPANTAYNAPPASPARGGFGSSSTRNPAEPPASSGSGASAETPSGGIA